MAEAQVRDLPEGAEGTDVTFVRDGKEIVTDGMGNVTSEKEIVPMDFSKWDDDGGSPQEPQEAEADEKADEKADAKADEKADAKEAKGSEPPVETAEERIARLEEENARYRQMAAHEEPAPPEVAPAEVPKSEVDYSEMPKWDQDGQSLEEYQKSLQEWFGKQIASRDEAHAKSRQEHEKKVQESRREHEAKVAQSRNEARANQVMSEIRAKSADVSDADFETRFASLPAMKHPEWTPEWEKKGVHPNTIHVNLIRGREAYMTSRAQSGQAMSGHDTAGDIIAAQIRDPKFAESVSKLVPNTVEAGNFLKSISESQRPVALLRYFAGDGKEQAGELSKDRGGAEMARRHQMAVQARDFAAAERIGRQRAILENEIRSDVQQIERELIEEEERSMSDNRKDDPYYRPPPPNRQTRQPSRAANEQDDRRGSRPGARTGVINPFDDAGSDQIVEEAKRQRAPAWRVV